MSRAVHFQTRARAIDHLGRGQIADCPTAVTELFKNAHDAYARNVSLHIFEGDPHYAAIFDDGCGMSADEIVAKWLVIGTESKIASDVPTKDRFGLAERPRLGEKGIGRLSAGFLAPVTLLVTRKKNSSFAAALVDWRFFENPYLLVSDIEIPMEQFRELSQLPGVYKRLVRNSLVNLTGKGMPMQADKTRVAAAWQQFDKDERTARVETTTTTAIQELADTLIDFDSAMSLWFDNEKADNHGAAIFLIGLRDELSAWFEESDNPEADEARMHLRLTLTGFIDPNASKEREFSYYLQIHRKDSSSVIMDSDHQITTEYLQTLEHYLRGTISAEGWFSGHITAFGVDRGKCKFRVEVPNLMNSRGQSRVGEFAVEVATVEQAPKNSTHSKDELQAIKQRQDMAGGMMVYRDGVRVLPYGRPDSDFFGLEERRSKHAGREFWADRRVFGRVRISREGNPLLRDKAGREGLVENQAKRLMRQIVIEVLKTAARRYFGSGSPIRETELKTIQERNERGKAAALEARRTRRGEYLSASRQVGRALHNFESIFPDLQKQAREAIKAPNSIQLSRLRAELGNAEQLLIANRLPVMPKGLEDRTDEHRELRDRYESSREHVSLLYNEVSAKLAECEGKRPERIVAAFRKKNVQELALASTDLLAAVQKQSGDLEQWWSKRFQDAAVEFESATLPYIEQSANGESVAWATDQIRAELMHLDTTVLSEARNAVQALKLLTQGIDLTIALEVVDESDARANERIEQLNLLAQSGIAVELISHELEEMAQETESSLKRLPENCRATPAFKRAVTAFSALVDRFRFLAPLSVATYRARRVLRGDEIGEYVRRFFSRRFESSGIQFESTDAFDSLEITDVPSRIFPVFINLVNNSVYWLRSSKQKKIQFDLKGDLVIVADSGPGIDKDDVANLFQMFFTKRPQGRGIGLYLCRTNLAVARHRIRLATADDPKILSGANFIIEFRGLNDR